jgi:Protein of unknown function (DUF3618)
VTSESRIPGSGPAPQRATTDDPDQIRREIERTQTALSSDVDALSEKVTPGRIVERRVNRVRSTATRWKDRVMGSNPMGGGSEGLSAAGGAARDTAQRVAGTSSSVASSVTDTASGAASAVGEAVSEAPRLARQQAQGNPLAAGLIAFGAGWLISSLLPATRREQQLAEQARDKASELGQPVAEAARQAATEVKDNLAQPAQQAVGTVRETAAQAGRTVTEEGKDAAGQVQGRAQQAAGTMQQNAPG